MFTVIRNVLLGLSMGAVLLILVYGGLVMLRGNVWWADLLVNFTPFFFLPAFGLLPLALLVRAKRALLLNLLMIAAALAWFLPFYLPSPASEAEGFRLRIVNLNAHLDNRNPQRVVDWLREIDADMVLIQEMPRKWLEIDGDTQLRDQYPYQISQTHRRNLDGKIFLSRYPIVGQSIFRLTILDRFVQQRIEVETPTGRIVVYNLHLRPNYGDYPRWRVAPYNPLVDIALSYDERIRNLQMISLLERLATENEDHPLLVGGDFNTTEYSYVYDLISARFTDSFREAGYGFGMSWPVARQAGLPGWVPTFLRLDYLWHNAAFEAQHAVLGAQVGSDHYPLITDLILKAPVSTK